MHHCARALLHPIEIGAIQQHHAGFTVVNPEKMLTLCDPQTGSGDDRVKVTFLRADSRAARSWDAYTSFAQTYVDLFATPGWQASELGRVRGLLDYLGYDLEPSIVDAYIPWESALGNKLRLKKGWRLLNIHTHRATKLDALPDRPETEKDEKDAPRVLTYLHGCPCTHHRPSA